MTVRYLRQSRRFPQSNPGRPVMPIARHRYKLAAMEPVDEHDAALVAAARALAPRLAAAGDEIERSRRLPDWLVGAMRSAGWCSFSSLRSLSSEPSWSAGSG